VLTFLDAMGVEYVVAMAKNAVLNRLAEPEMEAARRRSEGSGQTEHVYGEGRYQAESWRNERRVVFKAEVVRQAGKEPKDNPRFVVTNLKQSPQWIYEQVYCERGDIENRIKELHHGLEIDRTSCTKFWANQFRVLMTAAAYVLMQELRLRAARTACARAQVWTLRERLLKLGASVVVSVRRVVIHLPASFPYLASFRQIALALGAGSG
jgi:Transposase DDE domain group 1